MLPHTVPSPGANPGSSVPQAVCRGEPAQSWCQPLAGPLLPWDFASSSAMQVCSEELWGQRCLFKHTFGCLLLPCRSPSVLLCSPGVGSVGRLRVQSRAGFERGLEHAGSTTEHMALCVWLPLTANGTLCSRKTRRTKARQMHHICTPPSKGLRSAGIALQGPPLLPLIALQQKQTQALTALLLNHIFNRVLVLLCVLTLDWLLTYNKPRTRVPAALHIAKGMM